MTAYLIRFPHSARKSRSYDIATRRVCWKKQTV